MKSNENRKKTFRRRRHAETASADAGNAEKDGNAPG